MKFKGKLRTVSQTSLGLTLPSSFPSILPWVKSGVEVDLIISVDGNNESYIKIVPTKNGIESSNFSDKMRRIVASSANQEGQDSDSEE